LHLSASVGIALSVIQTREIVHEKLYIYFGRLAPVACAGSMGAEAQEKSFVSELLPSWICLVGRNPQGDNIGFER
jgi:hypothetical protein